MTNKQNLLLLLLFIGLLPYGKAQGIKGTVKHYAGRPLYLYQCHTDTLLLIDSVHTDDNGNFFITALPVSSDTTKMYRINLTNNQWFYLLWNGTENIQLTTVYYPDKFHNWLPDSMHIEHSDENKWFYQFIKLQSKKVVADKALREIMRLYPYYDSFRNVLIAEYNHRYQAFDSLYRNISRRLPESAAAKVIAAYHTPNPAWDQPDYWRDSIIAAHYFDAFHPADAFYINTNILPEKINDYLALHAFLFRIGRQSRSAYETELTKAAHQFLTHTHENSQAHLFALSYLLKYFNKEKMYDALFSIYDKWVYQAVIGDCEQTYDRLNKWRQKVSILKNIQIGSKAPDFAMDEKLNLYQLPADNVLLLFWASWCPHCVQEIPEVKKVITEYSEKNKNKRLLVIAISLDTDEQQWQTFVNNNKLTGFINYSELKGWQSSVVKLYNVYATPTMFLLDYDKKIIAKPENASELKKVLN